MMCRYLGGSWQTSTAISCPTLTQGSQYQAVLGVVPYTKHHNILLKRGCIDEMKKGEWMSEHLVHLVFIPVVILCCHITFRFLMVMINLVDHNSHCQGSMGVEHLVAALTWQPSLFWVELAPKSLLQWIVEYYWGDDDSVTVMKVPCQHLVSMSFFTCIAGCDLLHFLTFCLLSLCYWSLRTIHSAGSPLDC